MNLENKTVLITGGNRGIGEAIAYEFAEKKYNIIISYCSDEEKALKTKDILENTYKVKVLTIKCDLSNEDEIKNLVDESISEFGKIDVLVNNAAIAIDTLFEDKTKENFMKILEVNLVGAFLLSRYVGDIMLNNNYGKIVNISSNNAVDAYYPMSLDYDASKAGLISLTHNLAVQYAPVINVNAITSGWVNTDMNKELDKEFIDNENKKILLNRFAEPNEIAKVVAFLASDDARYINNAVIRVDGGFYV